MKRPNRWKIAALAVALTSWQLAHAQPLTTADWQGNTWGGNVNNGSWFPTLAGDTATFTRGDTEWGQIRTQTNFVGSVRATFEVNPSLQSGGTNPDEAFFGFGQHWFYYHENPVGQWVPGPGPVVVGMKFSAGSIYIVDGVGTGSDQQVLVGTYTPGQWVQMTLDLSAAGYLQVVGGGVSAGYQTTNVQSWVRFIAADANSTDGFQLRNVSVVARTTPLALSNSDWLGNWWDQNINNGTWFPSVTSNVATFAISDTAWGQIRTLNSYTGSISATIEVRPSLASGGANPDGAFIGFGQHWCYYHENPVGQWVPGPGPASLGVWLNNGTIYLSDGFGTTNPVLQAIGTYVPGNWIPFTLDLNVRGVLRISAPGINTTYTTRNVLAWNRFIVADEDSVDGFEARNISVGEGGNILSTTTGALYYGLHVQDGLPGRGYRILSSPSLTPPVTWTPVTDFTQSEGGFHWVDSSAPANSPQKFYKVIPLP